MAVFSHIDLELAWRGGMSLEGESVFVVAYFTGDLGGLGPSRKILQLIWN